MKPLATAIITILVIIIAGCSQHAIGSIEENHTYTITAPNPASYDTPSITGHSLYWADSRAGHNKTCTRRTCQYDIYHLNLTSGEETRITEKKLAENGVSADKTRVAWIERHPENCTEQPCKKTDRVIIANRTNPTNRKVVYTSNTALSSLSLRDGRLVAEIADPQHFNQLVQINLDTGDATSLGDAEPEPSNSSYSIQSEPFISPHGTIWYTYVRGWADEILTETKGHDPATNTTALLRPPGGYGLHHRAIDPAPAKNGLVWVHGNKQLWEVWTYNEQTSQYKQIHNSTAFIRHPRLRGNTLAYSLTHESGRTEIKMKNVESGEERTVADQHSVLLSLQYEPPYIVWTVFGHSGQEIRLQKVS